MNLAWLISLVVAAACGGLFAVTLARRRQGPVATPGHRGGAKHGDNFDWTAFASDRFWEMDAEFRFRSVIESGSGKQPSAVDSILGSTRWELAGIDLENDEAMLRHRETLESHEPFRNFRYSMPVEGGEREHWRISGAPVFDAEGNFAGYRGMAIDESDLVRALDRSAQAEQVLKERDAQFQHAVEVSNLGYYTWNEALPSYDYVSDSFMRLHGVEDATLFVGYDFRADGDDWRFIHPDDLPGYTAAVHVADSSGKIFDHQYRLITADGDIRHVRERGDPVIVGACGELRRSFGTVQDITDLKKAEAVLRQEQQALKEAVRESEVQLQLFIDHSQAIVFMKDLEGRFRLVNQRFAQVFDVSQEEIVGKTDFDIFPPAHAKNVRNNDAEIIESGRPLEFEEPAVHADGVHTYMSVKFPIFDATGKLQGIGGIATDITERKRTEAEREQLVEALEGKNAELERFTYSVSHDLKSPLITIRGFIGMIRNDLERGAIERVNEDLARVDDAAQHMQLLLTQLLELCRTSHQPTGRAKLALTGVVQKVTKLMEAALNTDAISVELLALPTVWGDEARLLEVFQNLLENAIKFSECRAKTEITIGYRPGDEPIIYVRDNGIGIDKRFAEKIFELFEVLDPESGGTGVGLALVKRIIEAHDGRVWIESAGLDQGTTVCFTLGAGAHTNDNSEPASTAPTTDISRTTH